MKLILKYLDKVLSKEDKEKKRDEKTKRFAREVTKKYKKTLRKLSYE